MAEQYHQVSWGLLADGIDSQPDTNACWSKVGVALSGGSCLALLSVVVTTMWTLTLHNTSIAESTNLLGVSRPLRSPHGGAVETGVVTHMDPRMVRTSAAMGGLGGKESGAFWGARSVKVDSFPDLKLISPLEKIAVTAIKASQLDSQLASLDSLLDGTQTKVEETRSWTSKERLDTTWKLKNELMTMDAATKVRITKAEEAVIAKAQDMAGITAPLGFFDPLGFSTNVSAGRLLFYREVEVKHGRVAMLASLGILVAEQFHPLFGGSFDEPSVMACQETSLQTFWPAVFAAIAIPEMLQIGTFEWPFSVARPPKGFFERNSITKGWSIRSDRMPGDFETTLGLRGFDPLGLRPTNPEEFKEMQTKELNNGRLAMIAAAGMIAQEVASGRKIF